MIYETPLPGQYIRFVKGTEANWARLDIKHPDTLYFVVANNGQSGKLYLGDILIGSTGGGGGSSVASLADLSDVLIETVADRDILVYNTTSGKWEPESVDELIAAAVAQMNHLSYTIVNDVADIDPAVEDADQYIYLVPTGDDSYDEYMVIDGAVTKVGTWDVDLSNYVTTTEFNERVGAIENRLNDTIDSETGDTIFGLDTRVGNLEALVDNNVYVLNSVYQAEVGDLTQLINSTSLQNPTLVDQVNDLTERLTWYEITDSND